jgi:hypothetical protein
VLLDLPNGLPSGCLTKILRASLPIHATWPAHLIPLYLITRLTFADLYRSWSSLLCIILQCPVTWPS